jgi:hypothetical protein
MYAIGSNVRVLLQRSGRNCCVLNSRGRNRRMLRRGCDWRIMLSRRHNWRVLRQGRYWHVLRLRCNRRILSRLREWSEGSLLRARQWCCCVRMSSRQLLVFARLKRLQGRACCFSRKVIVILAVRYEINNLNRCHGTVGLRCACRPRFVIREIRCAFV